MDITEQICTLDQAIQLKDIGIIQTAQVHWNKAKSGPHKESPAFGKSDQAVAAAFSVAELGKMMPESISNYKGHDCFIVFLQSGQFYYCCIRAHDHGQSDLIQSHGSTEAIARAQLILHAQSEGIEEFSTTNINRRYNAPHS